MNRYKSRVQPQDVNQDLTQYKVLQTASLADAISFYVVKYKLFDCQKFKTMMEYTLSPKQVKIHA